MPKKIYATIFFAVLLAIVAFALPTPVMAQDGECTDTGRDCETPDGWTVTLVDGYPMENTDRCPDLNNWEYRYEVCKPGTSGETCKAFGLRRVNIAIPDYCPDDIKLTKAEGCMEPLRTFPIGAGDPITKFEKGDQFVYAARLPYWGPKTHERSFCANTKSLDETSICLDRFRAWGLDCCKILGPGREARAGVASTATLSNTFGPDKFVFLRSNPSLKCPDIVYGCDKGDSDEECIDESNRIEGDSIAGIVDTDAVGTDDYRATKIEVEGACVVWAQIGTASKRCAIIGGKKYCR